MADGHATDDAVCERAAAVVAPQLTLDDLHAVHLQRAIVAVELAGLDARHPAHLAEAAEDLPDLVRRLLDRLLGACLAHVRPPLGRRERRRVWHGPLPWVARPSSSVGRASHS